MNYNKYLGAASTALMIVAILSLMLPPSASAQSKYRTLHKFTGADGDGPMASLVFDKAGSLYGTTVGGGGVTRGTVFKLSPQMDGGWAESVLYSFQRTKNGVHPYSRVIFDQGGNLYGTTEIGGNNHSGVVFELTPQADGTWTEKVLHSFMGKDGSSPLAGLIFDQAGNLYGTTVSGGNTGNGVVFKMTPNADGSWSESVLYSFTRSNDGAFPEAGLIFDQAGNLYGTTPGGVFELTPQAGGTWTEKILHQFRGGKDGASSHGDLVFDHAGNLYGTTVEGGSPSYCRGLGCGTVFKMTPNSDGSWKETVLHRFTGGKDGSEPYDGVTFDRAGNLYGTTSTGGNLNCGYSGLGCGVVFKLTPNSTGGWQETVLQAFAGNPGAIPYAGVIFDAAGNLYGTTQGFKNGGSVFEITP